MLVARAVLNKAPAESDLKEGSYNLVQSWHEYWQIFPISGGCRCKLTPTFRFQQIDQPQARLYLLILTSIEIQLSRFDAGSEGLTRDNGNLQWNMTAAMLCDP